VKGNVLATTGAGLAGVVFAVVAAGPDAYTASAAGRPAASSASAASSARKAAAPPDERAARGRYLVTTIGCSDCHTPKKMGPSGPVLDESRLLSGHPEKSALPPAPALPNASWIAVAAWDFTAWNGPWGTSYAFNLTPDENTGIGSWSEETFVRAIKTGRHMGVSRPILPPMPWEMYRNLTEEDLGAIYAYLRTIKPVRNRVPEPLPPGGGVADGAAK
jgi:mono/diheme cytochrome c family protein